MSQAHTKIKVSDKLCMTIEDASILFSIGINKLTALCKNNPYEKFHFKNGNRTLILRDAFVKFLENVDSI